MTTKLACLGEVTPHPTHYNSQPRRTLSISHLPKSMKYMTAVVIQPTKQEVGCGSSHNWSRIFFLIILFVFTRSFYMFLQCDKFIFIQTFNAMSQLTRGHKSIKHHFTADSPKKINFISTAQLYLH